MKEIAIINSSKYMKLNKKKSKIIEKATVPLSLELVIDDSF